MRTSRGLAGLLGAAALGMTGCHAGGDAAAEPPPAPVSYTCPKASGRIVIDGQLDDKAWARAVVVSEFYPFRPKDATQLSPTKARLTWDETYLYVAIECTDVDIWSYSDQPDTELWLGDVVELFIKPSVSDKSYCEFVAAPNGALYDARYPSRGAGGFRRFKAWSSGAQVATRIDGTDGNWRDRDGGYTVEMAIPFAAFDEIAAKPKAGVIWTFALFRYDYSADYEEPLLLMSIPESRKNGFHYYEGYHRLLFAAGTPVK